MFWITLAAQAAATTPPPPPSPQGLISVEDYPQTALDNNEQGAVYFQLVVNPQGRVDRCSILLSSGSKALDDASCRIVITRARFSPARDESGKPIYSTYRQVLNWRIGYGSRTKVPTPAQMPPDFDLTVNQSPDGVKLPLQFKVSYFVRANGSADHCQVSESPEPVPQVLVDLACKAVMQPPVEIIRNRNNEPVDASNCTTVVRFSVKP